jgi:hypothetical protein
MDQTPDLLRLQDYNTADEAERRVLSEFRSLALDASSVIPVGSPTSVADDGYLFAART